MPNFLSTFTSISTSKYVLYCFQCYVLWHIYPFYILVDRAGAATVTLLTKEIPLRLLVEKKADVTMDSKGCQNQNFDNPVMHHGACRIERNATV